MTKYHAQKTTVNGITFDSKLEAERYQQLVLMEKSGLIDDLCLQPEFQIYRGWVDPYTGEKHKSTYYIADFQYYDVKNCKWIVEDTKGMETQEFRLKWKMVQDGYRRFFEFRKITRDMV